VKTFGPQLRFVFRCLPHLELHPYSELAVEAAEGRFWAMRRLLFGALNHLGLADLTKHAQLETVVEQAMRQLSNAKSSHAR